MVILFGMPEVHEDAGHFAARMLAQALYFRLINFNDNLYYREFEHLNE